MTVESGKTLAGIGSLLMGLSFASIIGFILLILGAKDIAEHYKDQSIYQNILKGGLFSIIGTICASIGVGVIWSALVFTIVTVGLGFLGGILGAVVGIVFLIIGFVFQLMAAKILRPTFNTLADRSGVNYFRTAGQLLWIGAVLTIVIVGIFLVAVSFIILAVAFFSMRSDVASPSYSQPAPNTQPPTGRSNFCPGCGAAVSDGATFCANCGKPL